MRFRPYFILKYPTSGDFILRRGENTSLRAVVGHRTSSPPRRDNCRPRYLEADSFPPFERGSTFTGFAPFPCIGPSVDRPLFLLPLSISIPTRFKICASPSRSLSRFCVMHRLSVVLSFLLAFVQAFEDGVVVVVFPT